MSGTRVVDENFRLESAACRGQREPERTTAAVARGHEYRRRLAPDAQLQRARELSFGLQGLHGHHQRGGAAGELEGLLVVGHARETSIDVRRQSLLHTQRRHAVLIVIRHDADRPVAPAAIEREGRAAVLAHLEAQIGAVASGSGLLCGLEQRPTDASSARAGRDGDRVDATQRGASAKEHENVAEQRARSLSDQHGPVCAREHVAKLTLAQPIAREARFLQA